MDDDLDTLRIEVRASTSGFRSDIESMRGVLDNNLIDGFSKAGSVFERGLLSAIRRGNLGFDDLKRAALQSMNEIAAQAVQGGIGSLLNGGSSTNGGNNGLGAVVSGALGALFGLPGRATGGPVAPGAAYIVGERGPEVFVPTSSGRIETGVGGQQRVVRVSINVSQPHGESAPAALRRSSRQVASQVRRALQTF